MQFIDFFAGIGGFRKGMELAGHKCVGFCEFDKFATAKVMRGKGILLFCRVQFWPVKSKYLRNHCSEEIQIN